MSEPIIEEMIIASNPTGPRITPQDIGAAIAHVEIVKNVSKTGKIFRWAIITTDTGFPITGKPSVSLSIENDRPHIGEKVAIDNAKDELWAFLAYKRHLESLNTSVEQTRAAVECSRKAIEGIERTHSDSSTNETLV